MKKTNINILVENGAYHLLNMGDVAMLQTALSRLRYLYPQASIKVLTTNTEKLVEIFPDVQPISVAARNNWFSGLLKPLSKIFLKDKGSVAVSMEDLLRRYLPSVFYRILTLKFLNRPDLPQKVQNFVNAIYAADLVIATGGGYIADAFKNDAIPKLETLKLGSQLGKPIVLFGQGLGPIKDKELLECAKKTFIGANFIALREKQAGVTLLETLSITKEKILITGDDAIELAYSNRNQELGSGIGVNLRVAHYSDVGQIALENVRYALQNFANKYSIQLLPIPIEHSFYKGYSEPDSATIQKILQGSENHSDGGKSLDTPIKVIKQVGNCRVVITGSYHGGVFALSQGIPVIGLAKSQYYKDKFFGLADQFGVGCEVLLLDDSELKEKLIASIDNAWKSAEKLRPQLLKAAQRQIAQANSAYEAIYELVNISK